LIFKFQLAIKFIMSKTQDESQEFSLSHSYLERFQKDRESFGQVESFRKIMIGKSPSLKKKSSHCPCLFQIYIFIISLIKRIFQRESFQKKMKTASLQNFERNIERHTKIVSFFRLLLLLKRCVKIMRLRTKYRKIEFITKNEINIIHDRSHFEVLEEKEKLSFFLIRSKTLRKLVISAMKFTKRNLRKRLNCVFSFLGKNP